VFREAGIQVCIITISRPSQENLCSTLFAAVYKRPEGGLFAFCFLSLTFTLEGFLGYGFWLLLWAFWCGKFLEGKRITKGKLLKGNV
jgi:hypothetical protein